MPDLSLSWCLAPKNEKQSRYRIKLRNRKINRKQRPKNGREETAINIAVACQLLWTEQRMHRTIINLRDAESVGPDEIRTVLEGIALSSSGANPSLSRVGHNFQSTPQFVRSGRAALVGTYFPHNASVLVIFFHDLLRSAQDGASESSLGMLSLGFGDRKGHDLLRSPLRFPPVDDIQ